jgi:arabinogalactan endo-1,4-beta-galactosidase
MKKIFFAALLLVSIDVISCTKPLKVDEPPAPIDYSYFAKGADIGWLSEMEAAGVKFYLTNGTEADCITVLKSKGINSLRFRVWVDPVGGWCGQADVVKMAVRAKNAGMRVMIDFHYSDFWADPGKQNKPKAWLTYNALELNQAVYTHTKTVLTALLNAGVVPAWVQIGNETNDGMLWEEGRASKNMAQFAAMVSAGSKAVRETSAASKVIVHISNGYDNAMFRWMFDGLTANKVDYDIIAMSLYPTTTNWSTLTMQCLNNMNDMVARYNKDIMISEIGMDVTAAATCKSFIQDMIAKTKSLANQRGLGVFYWEPQCYNSWKGYTLGAFDNTGKPTAAMDGFMD